MALAPLVTRIVGGKQVGAFAIALASLSLAAAISCSREPSSTPAPHASAPAVAQPPIPAADRPPAALTQVGASAVALYDAAVASDWSTAEEHVAELNREASSLPRDLPKPDIGAQLQTRVTWVQRHVADKSRVETMDDANAITRLVADLSALYQTDVPYGIVMLGYYGRQLELGIASGQPEALTRARDELQRTWNTEQPSVERRGDRDDAQRFTDIVVQLIGARRPADYIAPTRAELSEADRLEKLFRSAG